MKRFATRLPRAGAIVMAGLVLLFAGQGAARAAPADTGSGGSLRDLRADLVQLGVPVPSPGVVARSMKRLAVAAERESMRFPVAGEYNLGQEGASFGSSRSGRPHEGQDVMARTATPLLAITDGVVTKTGDHGGRGNYLAIFDPSARRTYLYLHMLHPSRVKKGAQVRSGEWVGGVGCTGSCFGDHLHLEVRRGRSLSGPAQDPLPLLQRLAKLTGQRPTLPPGES